MGENWHKLIQKPIKKKTKEEMEPERCYLLFEEVPLLQGECIRFGNDWDNVDHLTETSHEFYIKRPQTEKGRDNIREQGRKRERER